MISFCCPSRGRPELAKRLVDTTLNTASNEVEILFYLNTDDPKLEEYKDLLDEKYYSVGPNQSTCLSWNQLAYKSKFDIVMLMGDDVQPQTPGWDQMMYDEFEKYEDKILMIVPTDGKPKSLEKYGNKVKLWEDKPLAAPHFAVHRNWIDTLGYLAPPHFWHFYVDTYTQKVARKVNRCLYMPSVVFKAKKIINDDAGQQVRKMFSINERDDFVWTKVRDRHLDADVNLLKTKIN